MVAGNSPTIATLPASDPTIDLQSDKKIHGQA
jgi:hypothetical protein